MMSVLIKKKSKVQKQSSLKKKHVTIYTKGKIKMMMMMIKLYGMYCLPNIVLSYMYLSMTIIPLLQLSKLRLMCVIYV